MAIVHGSSLMWIAIHIRDERYTQGMHKAPARQQCRSNEAEDRRYGRGVVAWGQERQVGCTPAPPGHIALLTEPLPGALFHYMLIPLTQVEASCRHFSRPIGGKSSGRRHFRSTSERYLSQREKHFPLNSEKPPKASEVPEPRQLLWGCGWAQASVQTAGVSRGSQAEKGVREAAGVSRKSGVSPPASRDQPLQNLDTLVEFR